MIEDSTLDQRYQGLSAMDAFKNKIDGSTATNNPNGLSGYIDTYISNMNNRNQELDTIIQTFNSALLNNNLVGAENIVANTKNCLSNYLSKKSNLVNQLASLKELLEKYDKPLTSSLDSSNQRTEKETGFLGNGSNTIDSSNPKNIKNVNGINKYTGNGTREEFAAQMHNATSGGVGIQQGEGNYSTDADMAKKMAGGRAKFYADEAARIASNNGREAQNNYNSAMTDADRIARTEGAYRRILSKNPSEIRSWQRNYMDVNKGELNAVRTRTTANGVSEDYTIAGQHLDPTNPNGLTIGNAYDNYINSIN